jgi:hypothetical protein
MTGVMKALGASVQGDPMLMRRVNGWLIVFWLAMIAVSLVTHWITSVTYVAALSIWGARIGPLVRVAGGPGRGQPGARGEAA